MKPLTTFQVPFPLTSSSSTQLVNNTTNVCTSPPPRVSRMNPQSTIAVPSGPASVPPSEDENSSAPWMPLPAVVHSVQTPEQFDRLLQVAQENNRLLVVDFMASWCRKCKYLLPRFKKTATANENVYFATVDVNKVTRLPSQFRITNMPTFIFFKNGNEVHRFIGGSTPQKVEEIIKGKLERFNASGSNES